VFQTSRDCSVRLTSLQSPSFSEAFAVLHCNLPACYDRGVCDWDTTHDGMQLQVVKAVINPDVPRKEGNLSIN